MIDTTGIDDVFARLEETDKLKQKAIEQLLEIRSQIDEKLSRLGYVEGGNSQGLSPKGSAKKRIRRTKAQIEADRANAQGSGAHGKGKKGQIEAHRVGNG